MNRRKRRDGRSSSGAPIEALEDGDGGAYVTIDEVSLAGGPYKQTATWLGFHVTHTCPYADVYPHFVRPDLSRNDGNALGEGMSLGTFRNKPAVQISRRSNKRDAATETAAIKALKVMRWLISR